MTEQVTPADVTARVGQIAAELTIPNDALGGVSQQLSDLVANAGFQASTGTIAFAGQYSTGSFAVQYNDQNGGFSSSWPQWAFELAKAALLGNKRVWVASNGNPFGANLVFAMILP